MLKRVSVLSAFVLLAAAGSVPAQDRAGSSAPAAAAASVQPAGGQEAARRLPPADSPPLVRVIELAFPTQGSASVIEPQTYLYYIHTRPSRPSEGVWVPYDEATVLEDFHRLWNTKFLDNLWIDVKDEPYRERRGRQAS